MPASRMVRFCMAIGALLALQALSTSATAQSLEYPVKANYLVRFAAFVEWPAQMFARPDTPVTICIVGRDPFGRLIDQAASTQTTHGRRLAVRCPTAPSGLAGCHIAYVGVGTPTAMVEALDAMPTTLTVTDSAVSNRRGSIHFVLSGSRVRFHIDLQPATRGGLSISSRLLSLALTVRGRA